MENLRYTIVIYTPQELSHSSYIQTGLYELEKLGVIKVKVKLNLAKRKGRVAVSKNGEVVTTNHYFPKSSYYKLLDNSNNKSIFFSCDLYDAANLFSRYALEKTDYVFKRNYESKYVDKLPEKYKNKIHKLGLTFGVHSDQHKGSLKFFLANYLGVIAYHTKWDSSIFKRLFTNFNLANKHWLHYKRIRKISLFDKSLDLRKDDKILFQTRCFLHEKNNDLKEIHQQRYELIHFLKKNFPENFKGGFIPSKLAVQKYGDALSNISSEPKSYIKAVNSSSIVIYTRGLVNSPAWKMAEYCSQGSVILAEKLTTELPVELKNEKHVLYFSSTNELKEFILRLSIDVDLINTLSRNSREYYQDIIHPKKNIERILKIMLCQK